MGRDREEVSGEEEKQEAFIGHGRTKKGGKKAREESSSSSRYPNLDDLIVWW